MKKEMIKKTKKEVEPIVEEVIATTSNEKEELLALYAKLKELGISRLSDLENKIANCK